MINCWQLFQKQMQRNLFKWKFRSRTFSKKSETFSSMEMKPGMAALNAFHSSGINFSWEVEISENQLIGRHRVNFVSSKFTEQKNTALMSFTKDFDEQNVTIYLGNMRAYIHVQENRTTAFLLSVTQLVLVVSFIPLLHQMVATCIGWKSEKG